MPKENKGENSPNLVTLASTALRPTFDISICKVPAFRVYLMQVAYV
jgi:aminoglycoside N3'-acetyltransferase